MRSSRFLFLIFYIFSIDFLLVCFGELQEQLPPSTKSLKQLDEEWCSYLQKYPEEPYTVIYPRIPKCGSTTIDYLFRVILKNNNAKLVAFPPDLWGDDTNDKKIDGIKHMINTEIHEVETHKRSVSTFLAGHVNMLDWSKHVLSDPDKFVINSPFRRPIEAIQFTRECKERVVSWYFYKLFTREPAIEAAQENRLSEYQHEVGFPKAPKTGPNNTFDHDACFQNYTCLKSSNVFNSDGSAPLVHICGYKCIDEHDGNMEAGARDFLTHPEHFLNIGDLTRIEQYLEMLECTYPNSLQGIMSLYQDLLAKNESIKNSSGSVKKHSEAFDRIVADSCNPKNNAFTRVYNELILPMIDSRFHFMKANKQRCCRRSMHP